MTSPQSDNLPSPSRVLSLGSWIDPLTLTQARDRVLIWLNEDHTQPGRFVVTPNLDHAVLLTENQELRQAYDAADLVLADGAPLVWASKILGQPLPERVAGSDLVPEVLAAAPPESRVFLLGATEDSASRAAQEIESRYPRVRVSGRVSPPFGFEHSSIWSDSICAQIQKSQAQLILIGLGAPKQEIWAHRHKDQLPGTISLCAGATIDFFAGTQVRAPKWTQSIGLEWAHRLATNPRRLAKRYGKDALYFPALLARDALKRQR